LNEQENHAVDQVIAGLRAAQPSDGMEQRVLRALRADEIAAARERVRWSSHKRHAWLAVAARIPMAAGALLVVHTPHAGVSKVVTRLGTARLPVQHVSPLLQSRNASALVAGSRRPVQTHAIHRAEIARGARATGAMREVNFPTPPAPLTAQEKALLQIAEHPTPDEIALLDPVVRVKQQAQEEAQFNQFVAQADATDRP
jgi:hypothetical protein